MLIKKSDLKKIINVYLREQASISKVMAKQTTKKNLQSDLDQGTVESVLGLLGDASEVYAAITDEAKAVQFSENFINALYVASPEIVDFLSNPKIRNAVVKLKSLIKSSTIVVKLGSLTVLSEVLGFLMLVLAVPRMAYQVLDNLASVEGQLVNLKKAPGRKNEGKPLKPEDLSDKFTTGGLAKLGIKTKNDLFLILAANIISEKEGQNIGFKMLQDGIISNEFWGEILKARKKVKSRPIDDMNELIEKADKLPKEIKHNAIVLGFVTNVLGGLFAIQSENIQQTLSIKGFSPDDIIKFSAQAYDSIK
jgi:hypothetical protein